MRLGQGRVSLHDLAILVGFLWEGVLGSRYLGLREA